MAESEKDQQIDNQEIPIQHSEIEDSTALRQRPVQKKHKIKQRKHFHRVVEELNGLGNIGLNASQSNNEGNWLSEMTAEQLEKYDMMPSIQKEFIQRLYCPGARWDRSVAGDRQCQFMRRSIKSISQDHDISWSAEAREALNIAAESLMVNLFQVDSIVNATESMPISYMDRAAGALDSKLVDTSVLLMTNGEDKPTCFIQLYLEFLAGKSNQIIQHYGNIDDKDIIELIWQYKVSLNRFLKMFTNMKDQGDLFESFATVKKHMKPFLSSGQPQLNYIKKEVDQVKYMVMQLDAVSSQQQFYKTSELNELLNRNELDLPIDHINWFNRTSYDGEEILDRSDFASSASNCNDSSQNDSDGDVLCKKREVKAKQKIVGTSRVRQSSRPFSREDLDQEIDKQPNRRSSRNRPKIKGNK